VTTARMTTMNVNNETMYVMRYPFLLNKIFFPTIHPITQPDRSCDNY
jgi:hypothetical protein